MKIAYRRMSGAVGLSLGEVGARGLWFEKRRALYAALQNRGHKLFIVNRMTKASEMFPSKTFSVADKYDLLMIEFGSSNASFYGDDLAETQRITREFKGPIIFICDDPDLPYLWKTVPEADFSRWSVWVNAKFPQPFGGQPEGIRAYDFPVSLLQPYQVPSRDYQRDALVYLGRPKSREAIFRDIFAVRAPVRLYGKPKEWEGLATQVYDPPNQPGRAQFYRDQIGSLVIADKKHKRLGWRTGRAFHALMAGCPAVVQADHTALAYLQTYTRAEELGALVNSWADPQVRLEEWERQMREFQKEMPILTSTLTAAGI